MRAVVQRVSRAVVTSGGEILGAIGPGLVVFLAIHGNDGPDETQWMADKVLGLRIFEDEDGKMNRSLLDIGREILIVSQFTLYGDCRKGRRPGFAAAAPPTHAEPVYMVDGVVHYCVANMPGAVARTSTFALNNATIGHALALAEKGWRQALKDNPHLCNGLNVCQGQVTYEAVAHDLGYSFVEPASLLS